jgi:hypothetical protein
MEARWTARARSSSGTVHGPVQGAAQRGAEGLDVAHDRLDGHRCLHGAERADEAAGGEHRLRLHHVPHGIQ